MSAQVKEDVLDKDQNQEDLVIYSDVSSNEESSSFLGDFRPLTVDDADTALVSGLISIQDYSRYLVSVEPLADTLKDMSLQIRKGATFELKKRGGRNAVKLLEQALSDGSEEVRLFAAEALEKLDSMYYKSINGLILRIKENPSGKLYFLLGKVYFDYAYKGMYDDGMRKIYYHKALSEFKNALGALESDRHFEVWDFLGSVCYELAMFDEALEWFTKLRAEKGESPSLLLRIGAIYFATGEYEKVRNICQMIRHKFGTGEHDEIISFWLE